MFNKHDIARDACQLFGAQAKRGYDWWWHSFTAHDAETGEAKPFFIEFFLCNPALGGDEPVFGQLPGKPQKPSYLMVKAGAWGEDAAQLHRFFGWNRIKVDWGVPFSVEADDCFLTEDRTYGHVKVSDAASHPEWMCQDGEMSWDLRIRKITAFNVGFGADEVFRHAEAFEMFWHAEGMKSEFEGEVLWNGRRYVVRPEDCYGYADKNWGKDFTSPWVWLSSNNLTSEISGKKLTDSVFDIGGGRPKVGRLALPRKLLSAFWYEGKPYEFNFSKAWTGVRTEFDCKETDTQIIWHVEQRSIAGKMITDITCEKKDMLLVNYEAPDGTKRHNRLWNGGNGRGTVQLFDLRGKLIDRVHAENVGCEYGEYCKDYLIRKATESDLEAVNQLLRQVLAVHHKGRPDLFKAAGKKYTDTELLEIFSNPETPVFVYDKEGTVLGYAFCAFEHKGSGSQQELTTLYVDDICVDEKARGMHVGTALFEYVKAFAKESGCYNITLHVWECNPGARAFYESLGLTPQYTSMEFILRSFENPNETSCLQR